VRSSLSIERQINVRRMATRRQPKDATSSPSSEAVGLDLGALEPHPGHVAMQGCHEPRGGPLLNVEHRGRHLGFVGGCRSGAANPRLDGVGTHIGRSRAPRVGVLGAVVLDHGPGRAILTPELILERRCSTRRPRGPRNGGARRCRRRGHGSPTGSPRSRSRSRARARGRARRTRARGWRSSPERGPWRRGG